MADVPAACSRCGKLLEREPAQILVQSGPLHKAHPVINLCPACTDSMSRWFDRHHHSRVPVPAARHTERPTEPSRRDGHRHRRRWRAKRRRLVRAAVAISCVFVAFTILIFVIYQALRFSSFIF